MTEQDLNYVISVLKEEQSAYVPEWYSVLGFLYCHRIAGLFYKRAQNAGVRLPKKIEKILKETYAKQKRKVIFMRRYLSCLTEALSKAKVRYMLLKGSVLSNLGENDTNIYGDGERASNDIDILVQPHGITAVSKALSELGFVQGAYDEETGEIKEFSRMEIVRRRMNRGEVAPFVKTTSNKVYVP